MARTWIAVAVLTLGLGALGCPKQTAPVGSDVAPPGTAIAEDGGRSFDGMTMRERYSWMSAGGRPLELGEWLGSDTLPAALEGCEARFDDRSGAAVTYVVCDHGLLIDIRSPVPMAHDELVAAIGQQAAEHGMDVEIDAEQLDGLPLAVVHSRPPAGATGGNAGTSLVLTNADAAGLPQTLHCMFVVDAGAIGREPWCRELLDLVRAPVGPRETPAERFMEIHLAPAPPADGDGPSPPAQEE